MEKIVFENVSEKRQKKWVTFGVTETPIGYYLMDGKWPALVEYDVNKKTQCHALIELDAFERTTLVLGDNPQDLIPPFSMSDWVYDDIKAIIPTFSIGINGKTCYSNQALPVLIENGPVRQVYRIVTQIPQGPINIVSFFYIYPNQDTVEFGVLASYGNAEKDQPLYKDFSSLMMTIGEKPHIDFQIRKGLADVFNIGDENNPKYYQEIVTQRSWMRCRKIWVSGALLCTKQRFDQSDLDPERVRELEARIHGPITAISVQWNNHYGALGNAPDYSFVPWAKVEQKVRYNRFIQSLVRKGDEFDARPYAQPPASGTTGEQPDFGCMRGEHAVFMQEPWAIYDLLYSVQAWNLRPYANRETDSSRCLKINHPKTKMYNLRPDERFSRDDMLGWPNPVGWISGYLTSDSQHRSDNLLYAMWMLTRRYEIRETILDILENQKMELDQGMPPFGEGIGSPRGWGRPLLSMCHAYSCGFKDAEPFIRDCIAKLWNGAHFRSLPDDAEVRVLSADEAKYGWNDPNGDPITGVLGWQESIALIGCYAAWKQLGIPEAMMLIKAIAPTIIRYSFYFYAENGVEKLKHAYIFRYDSNYPGQPPSPQAFNPIEPNYEVFTTGACARWTLAAILIYLKEIKSSPDRDRAVKIVQLYGSAANWDDVCWWIV